MCITYINYRVFYLAMWLPEAEEVKKKRSRIIQSPSEGVEKTHLSLRIHGTDSFNERRKWSSEKQCLGSPWLVDRMAQL